MLEKLIEAIAALTAALNANTAALNGTEAAGEPAKRGRGRPTNAEKAAQAAAEAPAPAPAPAPVAAPAAPAAPAQAVPAAPAGLTYKDVADRLVKVAETKGRDAALGVLNTLQPGCPNLPALKPELWGAAVAQYDALLGAAPAAPAPAASSLI